VVALGFSAVIAFAMRCAKIGIVPQLTISLIEWQPVKDLIRECLDRLEVVDVRGLAVIV